MKRKIKIGIPRTFLYYKYYILWKNFFENLNCHIVLSPENTKQLLEYKEDFLPEEKCISLKIYLAHISSLINKCDYILIPQIINHKKISSNDLIYLLTKKYFPSQNLITYNINNKKQKFEIIEFIKMGFKIKKNIFKIIFSYIIAKKKSKRHEEIEYITQQRRINNNKVKVLIISYQYNIYDKYIGNNIIECLKEEDIEIIYSDKLLTKTSIDYFQNTSHCLYLQEQLGAINYYKEIYDGVIFLSVFPCSIYSIANKICINNIKKPYLNIIINNKNNKIELKNFIQTLKKEHDKL